MPTGAKTFSEAIRMAVEVFHTLKGILNGKGYATSVGDEGGFAPNLKSNEEACEMIIEAIKKAGYEPGKDIAIALDPATSELYDPKTKNMYLNGQQKKSLLLNKWLNIGQNG